MVTVRSLLLVSAVMVLLVGPAAAFAPGVAPPLRMGLRAGTCCMNMVRFHRRISAELCEPDGARCARSVDVNWAHTSGVLSCGV